MDEDGGPGRQGLAVDVEHGGLGGHRRRLVDRRTVLVGSVEVDLEVVGSARVGATGELLVAGRRTEAVEALVAGVRLLVHDVAPTEAAVVVPVPPRGPDAELEVVTVRRRVGGLARRDEPTDLGVGERPAGEVLGVDGDGRRLADVVRAGRFGARRHLVLGCAEVLDLEPVAGSGQGARAREFHVDVGGARVRLLGDVDREVEAAECVERHRAGRELVALRVVRPIVDRGLAGDHLELGIGVEFTHESGDPHGLARSVDATVVDDVPATVVRLRLTRPTLEPSGGEHGGAVTGRRHESGDAGSRQLDPSEAVGVGGDRLATTEQLDRRVADGFAGRQVGGPDQQFLVGHEGVDAERRRLDPGDDRLVLPVLVRLRRDGWIRPGTNDDGAGRLGDGLGEIDDRLGDLVRGRVDLDGRVEDDGPVRIGRLGIAEERVAVLHVLAVLLGRHAPRRDVEALVVHAGVGDAGGIDERIGGDEVTIRPGEERERFTDPELIGERVTERLAEHVDDLGGDRHGVGGVAGGRAADDHGGAARFGAEPGHGRVDAHDGGIERLGVERVAELDDERRERATVAVSALAAHDGQWRVGTTALAEPAAEARPFERGDVGSDRERHGGVGLERRGGDEGDGTVRERLVDGPPSVVVRLDLLVGRETERTDVTRVEAGDREDRVRVDALVERRDEDRVERHRVAEAGHAAHARGGCGERVADVVGELGTVRRGGPGRHRDRVLGRRGESVDPRLRVGHDLESQRACSDPAPASVDSGRHLDRDVGGVELVEGGQWNHGLVEGQGEERSDVHLAVGLEPDDLERAVGDGVRHRRSVGRRRERSVDGLTDQRGAERLGRTVELLRVVVRNLPGRQTVEHRLHLVGCQRRSVGERDGLRLVHDRLPLAESESEFSSRRRGLARAGGRRRPVAGR